MALCVALALTNQAHVSIDYPVTVFGASRNSGGGWTAAKKHHGRIADQKHLPNNILDNWNENLPQVWTEQIIYPQTIHEVISVSNNKLCVSYPTTYGSIIAYEPHVIFKLLPVITRYVVRHPTHILNICVQTVLKIAGRVRVSLHNRTGIGMPFDLYSFATISDVMSFIQKIPMPAAVTEQINNAR
jgi:hypothetical protein